MTESISPSSKPKSELIGGVIHFQNKEGDWEPDFTATISNIGFRQITYFVVIAFFLNVIFNKEYRSNFFSATLEQNSFFLLIFVYMGALFFDLIFFGIQSELAKTNPETGMKELLPFKLAFVRFFFTDWIVNFFLAFSWSSVATMLGINGFGRFLFILLITIMITILRIYIERFGYNNVKEKWIIHKGLSDYSSNSQN